MSINATLIVQLIVFLILVWFTMKFVWPPIEKALDDRAKMIKDGLSAADKAKAELATSGRLVEQELAKTRIEVSSQLSDAENRAAKIVEEARDRATVEAEKIVVEAQAEAQRQVVLAREGLREQVALLAVKGAEQILRKEVNASVHAELLNQLKTEL